MLARPTSEHNPNLESLADFLARRHPYLNPVTTPADVALALWLEDQGWDLERDTRTNSRFGSHLARYAPFVAPTLLEIAAGMLNHQIHLSLERSGLVALEVSNVAREALTTLDI